jgi:hypothetical protein
MGDELTAPDPRGALHLLIGTIRPVPKRWPRLGTNRPGTPAGYTPYAADPPDPGWIPLEAIRLCLGPRHQASSSAVHAEDRIQAFNPLVEFAELLSSSWRWRQWP